MNGNRVEKRPFGVITKSYKEILLLDGYGIQAIAPPSESILLTENQMDYLKSKWDYIYTLTDCDRTGILFGLRMQRQFNTHPLWLTDGRWDSIVFGKKDPTDYIDANGKNMFSRLVEFCTVNRNYLKINNTNLINFCKDELGHFQLSDLADLPF